LELDSEPDFWKFLKPFSGARTQAFNKSEPFHEFQALG
jgi:hypothetical protein